jgi:hypothetical protein
MQPIIPIRRKEPFDGDGWLFELLRGIADTLQGADAVEERQPDEAVQRRLHRQWTTGAERTQKHVKHESV